MLQIKARFKCSYPQSSQGFLLKSSIWKNRPFFFLFFKQRLHLLLSLPQLLTARLCGCCSHIRRLQVERQMLSKSLSFYFISKDLGVRCRDENFLSQRNRESSRWPSSSAVSIPERAFFSNPSETKIPPNRKSHPSTFSPRPHLPTSSLPSLSKVTSSQLVAGSLSQPIVDFIYVVQSRGSRCDQISPNTKREVSPGKLALFDGSLGKVN